MSPLVSIIIITYNQESYIEEAIQGALKQQCNFSFEIVIGEDHSSDATLDICLRYEKQYPDIIRVIANPTNKGILDNYYDTLLMCHGKYIADCAGDDYWCDEQKLQRQVDILEKYQDVSLTYTNYQIYLQAENKISSNQLGYLTPTDSPIKTFEKHKYELLNQREKPFIFLGSSCFRKDTFLKVYNEYTIFFRNNLYTCEDFQLIFFLLKEGNFYYEDKETTVYRILNNSISHDGKIEYQFKYLYGTFILRSELLHQFNLDSKRCAEYLNSRLTALLSLSIRLNKNKERIHLIERCNLINHSPNKKVRLYRLIASSSILSNLFLLLKKSFH